METRGLRPIDEQIRLAIIGDGAAFTKLWDAHIDALRAYVKGWMKGLDDFYVEDICSRSFEKAFRQIKTYDPAVSQFFTWLRTIARNTALDLIEQEKRKNQNCISLDYGDGGVAESLGDGDESPLESIIRSEDQAETRAYIEGLPELYRDIAMKRLIEGMSYKDIADELEMELNTVRTRIRRAKSLIEQMKEDSCY